MCWTLDWTGLWTGLDSDNGDTEGKCLSGCLHLRLKLLTADMSFLEVKGHMYVIKVTMYYSIKFFAGNFAALYLRNYNRY